MKIKYGIILPIFVIISSSFNCNKSTDDVLNSFEFHISQLKNSYSNNIIPNQNQTKLLEISYDIKKTESIVTPYIGYIEYSEQYYDIENITSKKETLGNTVFVYKIVVFYQNNKWIAKEISVKTIIGDYEGDWEILDPTNKLFIECVQKLNLYQ